MSRMQVLRARAQHTSLLTEGAHRAAVWVAVVALLSGVGGGSLAGKLQDAGSAAGAASCGAVAILAGPIVNPANNHRYYLLQSASWPASEAEAVCLGGHLVTINNAAENTWVWSEFSQYGGVDRSLWIGLTDEAVEGTFVWMSGEPVTYTNWSGPQPDNAGNNEDHTHLNPPGGNWNDWTGALTLSNIGWPMHGVVELAECGNRALDPGEECDDGNTDPSDGCTNACTTCGNHLVTPPEQCDDGNLADDDDCSSSCRLQTVASGHVVFWNKLGSDSEIIHSEIGPGGERTGGTFTPGPFPNFGQAFVNGTPHAIAVTFPTDSVVSATKGTIAFWAKLNNCPIEIPDAELFNFSPYPGDANAPRFHWRIGFAANNGCGGGGLFGDAGVATDSYCSGLVDTATQGYWQGGTTDSILGDRAAWHHYAMVWDEAGIALLGGRKVYLYVDGELKTTPYYQDRSPWGPIPVGSRFGFGLLFSMTDLSIAVDNIIIWDGIKTDFSDRFIENPTDCGNGVVDPGEECDDGKTDPSDGCTKWCTLCGNGEITPPETCDDGNLTNGDRCEADCTLPRCGNGILDTGEECDDANGNDADGCTNACTLCGNGEVTPPEECDDGNTVDGDCCTASCQEPLHVVTGPVVNATTGHAYYLLEAGSWPASEAQAVCLGGHLVTIDDAAEENWVWVQFARYGGTDRSLWIGLSDAASEGTFVWSGSAPLSYTHWYPGEPNDCCSGQDFVHIYPPSDGRSSWWGDTDAAGWEGGAVHGVVEVAPPPSATPTLTPTSTPTRTLTSTNTPTLTPTSTTRPSDGGDGGGGGCTMTPTGRSGAVWWALAPAMVLWWARRRALGTREVTPIP